MSSRKFYHTQSSIKNINLDTNGSVALGSRFSSCILKPFGKIAADGMTLVISQVRESQSSSPPHPLTFSDHLVES